MPSSIFYIWPGDDEQLAGQAVDSHFDEDGGWWATVQQCGATLALAVTLALTASSTTLATQVFSQSQDEPAADLVSAATVQEEYWQNPVPPVIWPQPSVFTADDILVPFVQTFVPDDGSDYRFDSVIFLRGHATPRATLFTSGGFSVPAVTPVNPIDDSAVWAPNNPPWEPNWTLLFFLDDGSTVPAFQYDEDFWVSGVPPQLWWTAPQPFRAADDDHFVQSFSSNDEAIWTPQVPAVQDSLRPFQQFASEQHENAGNLSSFTDEIYWQNPVAPVPDSIWLLRQDAFDSQDPVGFLTLILDDGFQPNFVPPVADSLRLLQQWPFEQNEPAGSFRTTADEDFWVNPVQPYNWPQPSLFGLLGPQGGFDDTTQTFFNTFAQDEDFWQQPVVPPVQALNIYWQPFNLLGQQEDDTPVLVPFVPPPPPFCPLPPTGPDGDTKMSNFGGARPTLALFCRICKSGNPLVVRADYAIWCQDCCAFVSKQDTYMGTVQAPGQFRSIF